MNQELFTIYEEERAEAKEFRGTEFVIASQFRRDRVEEMLITGQVVTVEDFHHAAFIYSHSERPEDLAQAYLLAFLAVEQGYSQARYTAAHSLDLWFMRLHKPQKFGTFSIQEGEQVRLWELNPDTTDKDRKKFNVPALEVLQKENLKISEKIASNQINQFLITQVQSLEFEIELLDFEKIYFNSLLLLPEFELINEEETKPRYVPPGSTVWKANNIYCCKNAQGQIICSWHLCNWKVNGLPDSTGQDEVFERLEWSPQWISRVDSLWQRLWLVVSPETCWMVGGGLSREKMIKLASGLL